MASDTDNSLELKVGEHYLYRSQVYEVIAIDSGRVQLRSIQKCKRICFQSFTTLALAFRQGHFYKVQEAPLSGYKNNIIAGLSENNREKLNRRLTYVRTALEEFGGSLPKASTGKFLKELGEKIGDPSPPHYTSLYKWRKTYLLSSENPIALIPSRIKRKAYRIQRQPEEIQELINYNIQTLYLTSTPTPVSAVIDSIEFSIEDLNSKRPAYDQLVAPSKSTLRRIINELDTFETEKKQNGIRLALKKQHWSKKTPKLRRLLERAECDTHQIDVMIVNDFGDVIGKPYLTVILDVTSRRVIGWDISLNLPSLEKTIRAIKMSLSSEHKNNGLAMEYIADNGPEFVANMLKDIMYLMNSNITFCEPNEPNQKPHVERWFATLTTGLTHHIKGTTFSNPRARGDYDSEGESIHNLEQVRDLFKDWLDSVYHKDFCRSLNTSPDIYWAEHLDPIFPPKKFSPEDINRLFRRMTYATPVNGRIGLNHLQWTGPAVAYLSTLKSPKRELVLFYDLSELGTAWVCHPDTPDNLHQVEAVDPAYQNGLTMHMHDVVREDLKKQKRSFNFKEARDSRVRINLILAQAKGKRACRLKALLEESGSLTTPPLETGQGSSMNITNRSEINPAKHLAHSLTPAIAQVLEVPDDR